MTVQHYVAYEENGRIALVISCPPGMAEQVIRLNTDLPYIRVIAPVQSSEYYILNGALQLRPKSTAKLEGNMLKGVPAGASVTIEGQVYEADGSDIELSFAHPGTYEIKVEAFPQVDWTGTYSEN